MFSLSVERFAPPPPLEVVFQSSQGKESGKYKGMLHIRDARLIFPIQLKGSDKVNVDGDCTYPSPVHRPGLSTDHPLVGSDLLPVGRLGAFRFGHRGLCMAGLRGPDSRAGGDTSACGTAVTGAKQGPQCVSYMLFATIYFFKRNCRLICISLFQISYKCMG